MANVQVPVCGVQMDVMIGDNETNVQRMLSWIGDQRTRSARLIVFPECAVTGYCFESKSEAMFVAEEIPGPSTEALLQAAREHQKFIAYGILERQAKTCSTVACCLVPRGSWVFIARFICRFSVSIAS